MLCNSLELCLESSSSRCSLSLRLDSCVEISINLLKEFSGIWPHGEESWAESSKEKAENKTGNKSKKYKEKRFFGIQSCLLGRGNSQV